MKSWRWGGNTTAEPEFDNADANSDRVRFLTGIVNELRTPLTVIMGQIDAALIETDDEARGHQLRVASRNARRLARLADQAMDLTRLETNTLELNLRSIELVQYVESLVMSFEDLADRNSLLLEFISRRQSFRGESDPHVLTTIVSNLMSNAVKFTPSGGRIGVALDFCAPDRMQISIVDSGVGISAEQHERIFGSFGRPIGARPGESDGAGIGLALSRAMARLHGGDITVRSEQDKGCRFDVVMPIGVEIADPGDDLLTSGAVRPKVTAEILFRSTVESLPAEKMPGRDSILVVDANAEFRRWAAENLADIANVDGITDCKTALAICRESLPDIVIVDDRDSASDGVGFAKQLRADERTSHIPVVLISAHSDADRRAEAFEAGADDYLAKPIDAKELHARASGILARHQELRREFREQVVIKPAEISERSVDQVFLEKVTSTIDASIEDAEFNVQDLGDAVAMSTSQLSRKLRALIDQSPAQLVRRMRLQRAADLVVANAGQISDICFRVGFSDQSHFSRTFKRHFGVSPIEYRNQHAGADVD